MEYWTKSGGCQRNASADTLAGLVPGFSKVSVKDTSMISCWLPFGASSADAKIEREVSRHVESLEGSHLA